MSDLAFVRQHPPPATKEWDQFAVDLGSANVPKRLEENGFPGRPAWKVLVRARDANTDDVLIGCDQTTQTVPIGPGATYQIPTEGQMFTIGEWWGKSAAANQVVDVMYV